MSKDASDMKEVTPVKRKRVIAWSRQGCMGCKARRVKCTEEKPSCKKCVRRSETCVYPELKIRHHSICKDGGSSLTNSVENTERSPSLIIVPSPPPEQRIEQKLLHHFRNYARPSMPPVSADAWLNDVPHRAQSSPVLKHAILSLAATHLSTRDKAITLHFALDHRQKAFRGMVEILKRTPDQIALKDLDTVLASSYALARQSCFLPDGLSEAMALYRISEGMHKRVGVKDPTSVKRLFRGPPLESHEMRDMVAQLEVPPVDARLLRAGEESLLAFKFLCQNDTTLAHFHQSMLDEVRGYAESDAKGWDVSAVQWNWLMSMPARELDKIFKPETPGTLGSASRRFTPGIPLREDNTARSNRLAAMCLCGHWFSLGLFQDRQEHMDSMDQYLPALIKIECIEQFCRPLLKHPEYKRLVKWPMQLASVLRDEYKKNQWMSVSDAISLIYEKPELFI